MADHVSTVSGVYQAFGTGDVAWILDQLADDIAWDQGLRDTGLPWLVPGTGKEHVLSLIESAHSTSKQFTSGRRLTGSGRHI